MRRSFLFLAFLVPAVALIGDQLPVHERGFKPDLLYQFNGFDSITAMNGNLSLAIPLGGSYPVAEGLSYSFVLRYSANVWQYIEVPKPPGCQPPQNCDDRALFVPQHDNAGIGWRLSFGTLRAGEEEPLDDRGTSKWMYRSADGSEHYFYDTLHAPVCPEGVNDQPCDPKSAGIRYTRNGTYLRMVDSGTDVKVIEFPNGERHRFDKYGVDPATQRGTWRLRWIYNASSALVDGAPTTNYVRFDYQWSDSRQVWDIAISDSHGRTHSIVYTTGVVAPLVDKVVLAAFDGASAEYELVYNGTDGSTIDGPARVITRPCPNDTQDATSSVALLTHLLMPNVGTAGDPIREQWKLEYYEGSGSCMDESGLIKSATLPTLGRYEWTWQWYDDKRYPGRFGVAERRRIDVGATAQVKERTTYTPAANKVTVSIIDPSSSRVASKTDYFFTPDDAWTQWLPFTASTAITGITNPDGSLKSRYASSAIYECNLTTGSCSSTPDRVNYVRYEADATTSCSSRFPSCLDRNRRVVSERTLYVSDTSRYSDTDSSSFDGLGHYRKIEMSGNFGGKTRTNETNYNHHSRYWNPSTLIGTSVGTYELDANGARTGIFLMLRPEDPWVLGTYTEQKVTEGDVAYLTKTCFDMQRNILLRRRVLQSAELGSNDLFTVYVPNSDGNIVDVRAHGGDSQTLSDVTNAPCSMALPASSDSVSWIRNAYANGVLATSQYLTSTGSSVGFFSTNLTIDRNTGFVKESRDTAGVLTRYVYDLAGRLTRVEPAGTASTILTYSPAESAGDGSMSQPAAVTELVSSSGDSLETVYQFDSLGRIWHEKRKMPAGKQSLRETLYDAFGRKGSVSEWVNLPAGSDGLQTSPSSKTTFSYDMYGRLTSTITPDASRTDFAYLGERHRTRMFNVWTGSSTTAFVTEIFDRYGRVVEVRERSGPSTSVDLEGWVKTAYEYDPGNRLTSVTMYGTEDSRPVQQRIFEYDGRGFLVAEDHPETDRVSYQYDAVGNVILKTFPNPPTRHDLKFEYDRAGRLQLVREREPSGGSAFRDLKKYEYGTNNLFLAENSSATPPEPARTSYVLGKLHKAIRWNYAPNLATDDFPIIRVTETHEYADDAGRRTARQTEIAFSDEISGIYSIEKVVRQRSIYNDVGRVKTTVYPECIDCTYASDWTESSYSAGRVTSVVARRPQINGVDVNVGTVSSFAPSGAVTGYLHGNAMKDVMALDVMARPSRITFDAWDVCVRASASIIPASKPIIAGETVTLRAETNGTAPVTYLWQSRTEGGEWNVVPGASSSTLIVSPNVTTSYQVTVTNACGGGDAHATLTVVCTPPQIESETVNGTPGSVQPLSRTVTPGATMTLSVTASGSGSLSYSWYKNGSMSTPVFVGPTFETAPLLQTTSYVCVVRNDCGQAESSTIVLTVPLPQPLNFTATRNTSGSIGLQWSASAGAARYRIERRSQGGAFSFYTQTVGTAFTDSSVNAGIVYVYRVAAVDANDGSESPYSDHDLAATMTFTPIVAGMRIDDSHYGELLAALNALNVASGRATVSWGSILPFGVPAPGGGMPILRAHVAALRSRMNSALSSLGVAVPADPDSPLTAMTPIRASHLTALQRKVQ